MPYRKMRSDLERKEIFDKWNELQSQGKTGQAAAQELGVAATVLIGWRKRFSDVSTTKSRIKRSPTLVHIPIPKETKEPVSIVIMKGDSDVIDKISTNLAQILGKLP